MERDSYTIQQLKTGTYEAMAKDERFYENLVLYANQFLDQRFLFVGFRFSINADVI